MSMQTDTHKTAPIEPTQEMWGGLARDIVMWWSMDNRHGDALFRHLGHCGRSIPGWLRKEIPDTSHTPPKGTVAACIYKAMIESAPSPPACEVGDERDGGLLTWLDQSDAYALRSVWEAGPEDVNEYWGVFRCVNGEDSLVGYGDTPSNAIADAMENTAIAAEKGNG